MPSSPRHGPSVDLVRPSDHLAYAKGSPESRDQSRFHRLIHVRRRVERAIARQGALAFAIRKAIQAVDRLKERAKIGWHARREWLADGRPVFVFISHRCGGGTEQHLRFLIARLRDEGVRVVVVRPSRTGFLLWEERDDRQGLIWCRESTQERAPVEQLLELIAPVHTHVHHTLGVPHTLIDVLLDRGISYDWTIHDYYMICPRVNLVNAEHSYCGEPDQAGCNRCLACNGNDQGEPVTISIEGWRSASADCLGRARRVIVPGADVRDRLERYFPHLSVLLRPHAEKLPELTNLAAAIAPGKAVRVAVVGTLTAIKGSERLLDCARDALLRQLPLEFHVIGSTDRDAVFSRLRNVRVWGSYREHEVYSRLAAARCHLAFLPSLWPETYMYTLSVVMAARLYTICFDLGSQASRLRRWGWGQMLPLDTAPAAINEALLAAARSLSSGSPAPSPPPPARHRDILGSYYGFTPEEQVRFFSRAAASVDPARARPHFRRREKHARFH
jgi:glycosyltransferase involved in cell wall biosynthesis